MKQIFILLFLFNVFVFAQEKRFIIVDQEGKGDFKTITAAVKSLPMFNYRRTVIFVKNGSYNEKLKIDQDFITLKGESKEKTILHYSQLRSDWNTKKDSIGPGVINLYGDDFILENMTVENTQPVIGPHAFTIYGFGTRTILLNCNLLSKGGDTVSLWDYKTGMYYHANCTFVGAVDFVCPRGWCFIRDSKFYEVNKTASIWHAGGDNINQKFVITNSYFDGVKGFELGRHHYEAQFYLIGCKFSDSMSTQPIYRVVYPDTTKNRPFNWGARYFYFNCHGDSKDQEWFRDNFSTPEIVTPAWAFDNKWNPETEQCPKILKCNLESNFLILFLDEKVTVIGSPEIKSKTGKVFNYLSGGGSDTIRFKCSTLFDKNDLNELTLSNNAKIFGNTASVHERQLDLKKIPL